MADPTTPGATRIVIWGHSMGVPAAMSHAARGGVAHALVLMAPGHVPRGYFTSPSLAPVRDSIQSARELLAAGASVLAHHATGVKAVPYQTGEADMLRGVQSAGLRVTSIKDVTPIPHNGCRPPKRRRV